MPTDAVPQTTSDVLTDKNDFGGKADESSVSKQTVVSSDSANDKVRSSSPNKWCSFSSSSGIVVVYSDFFVVYSGILLV